MMPFLFILIPSSKIIIILPKKLILGMIGTSQLESIISWKYPLHYKMSQWEQEWQGTLKDILCPLQCENNSWWSSKKVWTKFFTDLKLKENTIVWHLDIIARLLLLRLKNSEKNIFSLTMPRKIDIGSPLEYQIIGPMEEAFGSVMIKQRWFGLEKKITSELFQFYKEMILASLIVPCLNFWENSKNKN